MNDQENLKLKRVRFTVLDGIIVFLILLCVVGICFRSSIMNMLGFGDDDMTTYKVTFTMIAVDDAYTDYVKHANKLYFSDGSFVGEVLDGLNATPAVKYIDDGNGSFAVAYYPEGTLIDAEGAFVCRGKYSEDGYFSIEGKHIVAAGQSMTLYTDYATLNITVTGVAEYHQ